MKILAVISQALMRSSSPRAKTPNTRSQGGAIQDAAPGCHIQRIAGRVQQTQNRDDFLLGSSLFTPVTMGAPSQALTQQPRSDEQVLASFQARAGKRSFQEPNLLFTSKHFLKAPTGTYCYFCTKVYVNFILFYHKSLNHTW